MSSHTIKVTGVPEELMKLLDERVKRRHASGRSEYLRELIRKDVLGEEHSLKEILAPLHASTRSLSDTDEQLDSFFDQVRGEVFQEKQTKKTP